MQYSIMARLDPRSRLEYVCESERESEGKTIFYLKPLSIAEYLKCESVGRVQAVKVGTFTLRALQYGLIGWDNFADEEGGVIPFDLKNISYLHPNIQIELAEEIVRIAELEGEIVEELKLVARWGEWLDKNENRKHQWECEFCLEKKLFKNRNCDGTLPNKCSKCSKETLEDECPICGVKTIPQFKFRFSSTITDWVARCPVAMLTPRAIQLTNIVNFTDNAKALPFHCGAFEQTYFFYLIRMVVLSEQNAILKKELDQKPDFNHIQKESKRHGQSK
jgi:hypothetical protein